MESKFDAGLLLILSTSLLLLTVVPVTPKYEISVLLLQSTVVSTMIVLFGPKSLKKLVKSKLYACLLLILMASVLLLAGMPFNKKSKFSPEDVFILYEDNSVIASFWSRFRENPYYREPLTIDFALQLVEFYTGFAVKKYWSKNDRIYIQITPRHDEVVSSTKEMFSCPYFSIELYGDHLTINTTEYSDYRNEETDSTGIPYSSILDYYWVNDSKGCRFILKVKDHKPSSIGLRVECSNQDDFLKFISALTLSYLNNMLESTNTQYVNEPTLNHGL